MRGHRQDRFSRRTLLGWGLWALPALSALAPSGADAQPKMQPKLVQYQETPKNNQKCVDCLHWVNPDSCKLVAGKINPNGWCALFAPKPKSK